MKLLSFDTTGDICSVAVVGAKKPVLFHESRPREHAKILLSVIDDVLEESGLSWPELDGIVVGRGPGSFTGVRIAIATAQGLAFSHEKPLYAVSTLATLAFGAGAKPGYEVWVAMDARMSEVYFAQYRIDEAGLPQCVGYGEQVLPPKSISGEVNSSTLLIGNGWHADYPMPEFLAQPAKSATNALPNAQCMAEYAAKLITIGAIEPSDPATVEPVYLRDKVTWDNKPPVGSK